MSQHATLLDAFQAASGLAQQGMEIWSGIKKTEADSYIRTIQVRLAEERQRYINDIENGIISNDSDDFLPGWQERSQGIYQEALKGANNQYTKEALEYMFTSTDASMRPLLENETRKRLMTKARTNMTNAVAGNNSLPGTMESKVRYADDTYGEGYLGGVIGYNEYIPAVENAYVNSGYAEAQKVINKALFEDNLGQAGAKKALETYGNETLSAQTLEVWDEQGGWEKGRSGGRPTEGFTRRRQDTAGLNARIMEGAEKFLDGQWNIRVKQEQEGNAKTASEKYGAMIAAEMGGDMEGALGLVSEGILWLNNDMKGWRMSEPDNTQYLDKYRSFYDRMLGKKTGGSGAGGGGSDTDLLNAIYDIKQFLQQGNITPDTAVTMLNQIRHSAGSTGVVNAAQNQIDALVTEINPEFKGITSRFQDMVKGLISKADTAQDGVRKLELIRMEDNYLHIIQQNAVKRMSRSDIEKSMQDIYKIFEGNTADDLNELFSRGIRGRAGEGAGRSFFNGEHDLNKYYVFEKTGSSGDIIGRNFFTGEMYYVPGKDFMLELVEKSGDLLEDMGYKTTFLDWAAQDNVHDDPSGLPIFKTENGTKIIFRTDGSRLRPVEVTLDDGRHIIDEKPLAIKKTIPDAELAREEVYRQHQAIRTERSEEVEAAKNLTGTARTLALKKLQEDGVIWPDEYAQLVSPLEAAKAWAEQRQQNSPVSPVERHAQEALRQDEEFRLYQELYRLSESRSREDFWKFRDKYDEYIKSGKITEEGFNSFFLARQRQNEEASK